MESTWGKAVRAITPPLKAAGILKEHETKFRFAVTASVDSGVGAHLDIDIYCRSDHENKERFCGHATILSDLVSSQQHERAAYVRVLLEAGSRICIIDSEYEYLIELNSEITRTDSRRLLL